MTRRKNTDSELDAQPKTAEDIKIAAAEQPVVTNEQKFAEDAKTGEVPDKLVSEGTRRGVALESEKEELRKAEYIKAEADVAKAKKEARESRKVESKADVGQYDKRLAELTRRSLDLSLSYNDRLRAREAVELLRAVINDMNGEGDPSGPTLATEDRLETEQVPVLSQPTGPETSAV